MLLRKAIFSTGVYTHLPFWHSMKLSLRLGPFPSGTLTMVNFIDAMSSIGSSNHMVVVSPWVVGELVNTYKTGLSRLLNSSVEI